MSKKNIIFLVFLFLIILVILLLGYFIYYFLQAKNSIGEDIPVEQTIKSNNQEIKKQQAEEMQNAYNEQFPDVITGVINIISDTKTTIKTEKGVEYLISPFRPKSFFKDSGIENGNSIEARGKIIDNNLFSLGSIIISK